MQRQRLHRGTWKRECCYGLYVWQSWLICSIIRKSAQRHPKNSLKSMKFLWMSSKKIFLQKFSYMLGQCFQFKRKHKVKALALHVRKMTKYLWVSQRNFFRNWCCGIKNLSPGGCSPTPTALPSACSEPSTCKADDPAPTKKPGGRSKVSPWNSLPTLLLLPCTARVAAATDSNKGSSMVPTSGRLRSECGDTCYHWLCLIVTRVSARVLLIWAIFDKNRKAVHVISKNRLTYEEIMCSGPEEMGYTWRRNKCADSSILWSIAPCCATTPVQLTYQIFGSALHSGRLAGPQNARMFCTYTMHDTTF